MNFHVTTRVFNERTPRLFNSRLDGILGSPQAVGETANLWGLHLARLIEDDGRDEILFGLGEGTPAFTASGFLASGLECGRS